MNERVSTNSSSVKVAQGLACQGCGHHRDSHGQVFEKSCRWKGCGCPQYVRKVTL